MRQTLHRRWTTALVALITLLLLVSGCGARTIVVKSAVPVQGNRDAVLILPGLGYSLEGAKDLKRFAKRLAAEGYDAYIPNIVARKGIADGVAGLGDFVQQHELAGYEKVHVFAYILGGITLNRYLETAPLPNLASIVYDRSPLQERAPALSVKRIPRFSKIFVGPVIFEIAKTEFPPLVRNDVPIGLIIENRATWFVRRYRADALAMGPISFDPDQFDQPYVAHCHVWLDHFEMYHRFDVVGPEILAFIRTGRFTDSARTEPFPRDPFSKK